MFALPTLREFIDNPMGKGSNAIPSRQLVRDDLSKRLKAMESSGKKIKVSVYQENQDDYYFHLLIPTESPDKKNTYDVLLRLFIDGDNKSPQGDSNLQHYNVQFFSNSPSFTYTYVYAFELYGFFIKSYSDKFKDVVLDEPPTTRNPGQIVNYEKSITFAVMYLLNNPRYLDKNFLKGAYPYKHSVVHQKIRSSDRIKMETDTENRRVSREKEKERQSTTTRENKPKPTSKNTTTPSSKIAKVGKIKPRGASKSKIRPRR